MTRPRTIDQARGKWTGILATLGVETRFLSGKHTACPMCGGKDRFRFDDKEGKGTYFCSGCGAGTGMDLVQKLNGWDFRTAASEIDKIVGNVDFVAPKPALDAAKRTRLLNDLWRSGTPAGPGDAIARYLGSRRLQLPSNSRVLRYVDKALAPENSGGGWHPCMVAMISDTDGKPASLHRTFLGPNGKADLDEPRAAMPGAIPDGAAIRLTDPAATLGIAEGIETALAATKLFGIPVWAAINSTQLAKWQPPAGTQTVVVFGDNDQKFGGAAAAYALAHRLATRRDPVAVTVKIPDAIGHDWADEVTA
jgi:putative DNA primase/helicase